MKMRTIQYAIDSNFLVWSRVGNEIAAPILDYEHMKPENNFETKYYLEKCDIFDIRREWDNLHWTRKIPNEIKNEHRKFWGMKPLKGKNRWEKD
jgi:hypothetical protein